MANNKIQIDIEANSRGAIEQLKATQTNINKVADTVARLEASGTSFNKMNQSVMGLNALIDRLASSMFAAGEASSFSEAKLKVLQTTLSSVDKIYKGDFSKIADHIRTMSDESERAMLSINNLTADEEEMNRILELQEQHLSALDEMWSVFDTTLEETQSDIAVSDWNGAMEDQMRFMELTGDKAGILRAQYDFLSDALKKYITELRESNGQSEVAAENIEILSKQVKTLYNQMNHKGWTGVLARFGKIVQQVLIFRTVMTIANKVSRAFKETITESIKTIGEAEQIYSKLNTVFTEYTDSLERADWLAAKLGVSTMSAASALSTVGDLLQAQGATTVDSLEMATEWVEQFQDIIAFKDINMSLEEFAQNFMSGASGNLRNFRQFGSIVRESAVNARLAAEGLDKLKGSELELAKVTIRAEIALEQQANAMGANAREWDTLLSVQRRYQETQKNFKENIGKELEPVVKWWTNFKNAILEALNEQMEYDRYMAGRNATGRSVNPDASNDEIWEVTLKPLYAKLLQANGKRSQELEESINNALAYYGVSSGRALDIFDTYIDKSSKYAQTARDLLSVILTERDALLELDNAAKESAKALLTLSENTDSFFESLMTLEGVDFTGSEWYKRLAGVIDIIGKGIITSGYDNAFSAGIGMAINQTVNGIGGRGFSAAQILFGEDDEAELLKKKVEDYRELYDMLLAAQAKGLEITASQLKSVYDGWEKATSDLKAYNDELERQQSIENALTSFSKTTSNYSDKLWLSNEAGGMTASGMREDLASALAEQKLAYINALAIATAEETEQVIEANRQAVDSITLWFENVDRLEKEEERRQKAIERQQKAEEGLKAYEESLEELLFENTLIGLDEFSASIERSRREFQLMVAELDLTEDELERANELYSKYLDALNDQKSKQDAEEFKANMEALFGDSLVFEEIFNGLKDSFNSFLDKPIAKKWPEATYRKLIDTLIENVIPAFGEIGDFMARAVLPDSWVDSIGSFFGSITDGIGALAGNIQTLIIDKIWEILSQLEVFDRLSGIVLDTLIPVLNDFLEPLLPVIDMLESILHRVFVDILVPLYPLLQLLAESLTVVLGLINGAVGLVTNVTKKVIGTIVNAFETVINWIISAVNKIPGINIKKIHNASSDWADINIWEEFGNDMKYMASQLEDIRSNTFDTAQNTAKADYATYADLRRRGMLSDSDYLSLIGSNKYSSSTTSGSVTMTKGGYGNTTYITMNGLTIKTDIDTPEKLVEYLSQIENGTHGYAVTA